MKLKEYKYKINGIKFTVGVGDIVGDSVHVEVNGVPYKVEIDTEGQKKPSVAGSMKRPAAAPRTEAGEKVIATPVAASTGADAVKSPLPGTVTAIKVKVGDTIKVGGTVCVLEAMKMENNIHSQKGGTVTKILVNAGDSVLEGADIMIIE